MDGEGQPKVWTPAECKSRFKDVFQKLTRQHNFAEVWADFVELGAICMHQSAYFNPDWMPAELEDKALPIDNAFRSLEERYLSFVPKYGKEGMTLMSRLYACTEYAVKTHRIDFLGFLYEQLDLSGNAQRGSRGEFFTPSPIAQLMAQLTLTNVEQIVENKGYVTLQEPCVGAGGMVIAAANQLESLGYDPRQMLLVDGIDVNKTFFNIAYLQLSAMDIPARLWWGNTLSLKMNECRETPQLKLSRFYWEKRPEFQMLKFLRSLEAEQNTHKEVTKKSEPAASDVVDTPMPDMEKGGQFRLF